MKTSLLIALALFLPFVNPASAGDGPTYSIIRTNSGKTYVNCSVYKTYPDHVILEFENGGAKVLFSDLTPELRTMLGHDPKKEAAYEKERPERERKERENLAKFRPQTAKIQAPAQNTQDAQYQYAATQSGYGGYAGAGAYPYYTGGYAVGYSYDNAGYLSNNSYGVGSTSGRYGYGDSVNSRYAYNRGIGIGSTGYGNGSGLGTRGAGPVTRGGVTSSAACRTNSNGSKGWNGNGGGHGNSFSGHNSSSRVFRSTPTPIVRPLYNLQPSFRAPVISRFSPALGNCVRR